MLDNGMIGYAFQSYIKELPKEEITSISLSIDNPTIHRDSTNNIQIKILPESSSSSPITWSSSDESIVTVENGVIRGVGTGKAVITAAAANGVAGTIEITVYTPVSQVSISRESLTLEVEKTAALTANVLPEDASNRTIEWKSENSSIATVDQTGKVTALSPGSTKITAKAESISTSCNLTVKEKPEGEIELEIDSSLRVEADEISGISLAKNKVKDILNLIHTNLISSVYNSKNEPLDDEDTIGTGSILILKDDQDNEIYKYTFIIFGDVNGDGEINALDSLVIQRHILETRLITGIFLKSGNISKNGNMPNALDVLKIQRHILETSFIEQ